MNTVKKIFLISIVFLSLVIISSCQEDTIHTTHEQMKASLEGNPFGPLWIEHVFITDYQYRKSIDPLFYEPFDAFLLTIGGIEYLTENDLIQFIASDLIYHHEHYEAFLESDLSFEATLFTDFVREIIYLTYQNPFYNTYQAKDFVFFLTLIYYEIYPDDVKNHFKDSTFDGFQRLRYALYEGDDLYDLSRVFSLPDYIVTQSKQD